MVNYLFDIARAVFAAVVVLFFLMLPEFVLGMVYPSFAPCWDPVKLSVLLVLALSLSLVKNKKFVSGFLFVFGSLQLIQFGVIMSVGRYVSPFDFETFAWSQIVFSIKENVWYHSLLLAAAVIIPYMMLKYIFTRGILNPPVFKRGWVLTVLFLAVFSGYSVSERKSTEAQECSCYASYNTLNSSAIYLADMLPQKIKEKWPSISFVNLSAQAAEK